MRLSEKLEAADGRSRELDIEVWKAFHPDIAQNALSHAKGMWPKNCSEDETKARTQSFYKRAAPAYTTSIDAALTLLPDGWNWMTGINSATESFASLMLMDEMAPHQAYDVTAKTPALALCAAICRAKGI